MLLLNMHFFHPCLPSTQLLQSALEISQWHKNLIIISDTRTSTLDFLALQYAMESAMRQACLSIEWVIEGGGNQVFCLTLGFRCNH
jgi:hypothetical protein